MGNHVAPFLLLLSSVDSLFCHIKGTFIFGRKMTGASMNPARSLGPAFATKNFHKLLLYIVAPVIGAVAGSTLYNLLRFPEKPKTKIVTSNFDNQFELTYPGL